MGWKTKLKRIFFITIAMTLIYQGGRQFFLEEEWAARNYIYAGVKTHFAHAWQHTQKGMGLSRFKAGKRVDGPLLLPDDGDLPVVVLIHGMDEPGRVWMNLAPMLEEKGIPVLCMTYPNDQEIVASARLFFQSIERLQTAGGRKLVIIGHSMGGLVAREMLTSPQIDYAGARAAGRVPGVSDLIMVGTPNHGSQLARFRLVMECREQLLNLFEPDVGLLQGVMDGTGAAGLDLIPGSRFLTRLNSRPHPEGVRQHVIAGLISPWTAADIKRIAGTLQGLMPGEASEGGGWLGDALVEINRTIGDGLVTMDSAMLDHISLTRVHGNHLTIIRNLTSGSPRVPPAIPVIFGILKGRLRGFNL